MGTTVTVVPTPFYTNLTFRARPGLHEKTIAACIPSKLFPKAAQYTNGTLYQ